MDPLSLITGVLTLLGGSVTVVKYLREVKDGGEEREKLTSEVSRLVRVLEKLKVELDEAQEDDPWYETYRQILGEPSGSIWQLQKLITDLDKELRPENRRHRPGHKLSWPLSKSRVKDSLNSIQRYSAEVEHFLSRGHFELSKTIHSDVQALREKDARETFDAITSWLSTLEFGTRQDKLVGGAIAAGQWLFESREFQKWASGQTRVLMCHGAPGAGKTVLVSLAIKYLQRTVQTPETPVLFLYLTHKEAREQKLPNLLGSLLKQLIHHKGKVPNNIQNLYSKERKKESRPTAEKMLDLFKEELEVCDKAYIVVDALDESEEDTRKSLIDFLAETDASRTSLLLTARSPGDTVGFRHVYCSSCGFVCGECDSSDSAQCQSCMEHGKRCEESSYELSTEHSSAKVQMVAQNADIKKYIEKQIQESSRLRQVCQKDRTLKDKITETIIGSTRGIFLIARLQIDFLKSKVPTPKKLLTFARCALSFRELQHAMGVTEGDVDLEDAELLEEDFLLPLAAGLITVDSEGASVRLIHYTLYEYLYERREELFPDSASNITLTLLTYLHFELFSKFCRGDQEDEDFETRLRKYPLLSYASLH